MKTLHQILNEYNASGRRDEEIIIKYLAATPSLEDERLHEIVGLTNTANGILIRRSRHFRSGEVSLDEWLLHRLEIYNEEGLAKLVQLQEGSEQGINYPARNANFRSNLGNISHIRFLRAALPDEFVALGDKCHHLKLAAIDANPNSKKEYKSGVLAEVGDVVCKQAKILSEQLRDPVKAMKYGCDAYALYLRALEPCKEIANEFYTSVYYRISEAARLMFNLDRTDKAFIWGIRTFAAQLLANRVSNPKPVQQAQSCRIAGVTVQQVFERFPRAYLIELAIQCNALFLYNIDRVQRSRPLHKWEVSQIKGINARAGELLHKYRVLTGAALQPRSPISSQKYIDDAVQRLQKYFYINKIDNADRALLM